MITEPITREQIAKELADSYHFPAEKDVGFLKECFLHWADIIMNFILREREECAKIAERNPDVYNISYCIASEMRERTKATERAELSKTLNDPSIEWPPNV